MLSVAALVLLIGALTMTVAAIGVGRARATAAADVAALAGAQHVSEGTACQWAREAARRNSAKLSDCRAGAGDVTVSVTVPMRVPFWPLPAGTSVRATARAGPAVGVIADRHLRLGNSLSCVQPVRGGARRHQGGAPGHQGRG